MKRSTFRKLLVTAVSCVLALSVVVLTGCGANDEEAIREVVNNELSLIKNPDEDTIQEIEDQLATDDTMKEYLQSSDFNVSDFMSHTFGRMEYSIDSVEVDGDTATVTVSLKNPNVTKAMEAANTDLYSMDTAELQEIYTSEGEVGLMDKVFELYYEEIDKAEVEDCGTVTYDMQKSDGTWGFADADTASSDTLGALMGS